MFKAISIFSLLVALAVPVLAVEKEEAAVIKEITALPAAGKPDFRGDWKMPTKISTADELTEYLGDRAPNDDLKAVDFEKSYVLVFKWAGSGQDKLNYEVDESGDAPSIAFSRKAGFTRDLRQHLKAFVIAKDATYTVGK